MAHGKIIIAIGLNKPFNLDCSVENQWALTKSYIAAGELACVKSWFRILCLFPSTVVTLHQYSYLIFVEEPRYMDEKELLSHFPAAEAPLSCHSTAHTDCLTCFYCVGPQT